MAGWQWRVWLVGHCRRDLHPLYIYPGRKRFRLKKVQKNNSYSRPCTLPESWVAGSETGAPANLTCRTPLDWLPGLECVDIIQFQLLSAAITARTGRGPPRARDHHPYTIYIGSRKMKFR